MTGFGKAYIVHTMSSNFYNFGDSWNQFGTDTCKTFKDSVPLSLQKVQYKFVQHSSYVIFMDPQMSKFGCMNYLQFPKSVHIFRIWTIDIYVSLCI